MIPFLSYLGRAVLVSTLLVTTAAAEDFSFRVQPGFSVLPAGRSTTMPVKISLTGRTDGIGQRMPVNVSFVIDRSGSMSGQKLAQAKEGVLTALARLSSDDIVSLVTYDSDASVVVPATRLYDRAAIVQAVNRIQVGGDTALFAGVSLGAAEVQKFREPGRVNRIVLLSDGLANVGPSSPGVLGDLGTSLRRDGISVTTLGLGLGYNEDLMTKLADRSDGNHSFVADASQLASIFSREFGDILSVAAQNVSITMTFQNGARPLRVLDREAVITGNTVFASLNQVYASQEKFFVFEVEVPAGAESTGRLVDVSLSYFSPLSKRMETRQAFADISRSPSEYTVEASRNPDAFTSYYLALSNERSIRAVALADKGDFDEAQNELRKAQRELKAKAEEPGLGGLAARAGALAEQEKKLAPKLYRERGRKELLSDQFETRNQQAR